MRSSRRQGAPGRGDCSSGESLSRPHALLDPAPARALRTRRRGWRRLRDRPSQAYAECAQRALPAVSWPWSAAAAHGESRPGGPGKWRPEGRGPGGVVGSQGGSASPGGFGREAVALGRAAMGPGGVGPAPEPPARRTPCGPPAPETRPVCLRTPPPLSFICLGSSGPRTLPLYFSVFLFLVCLLLFLLDPRTCFSPLLVVF